VEEKENAMFEEKKKEDATKIKIICLIFVSCIGYG